MLVNLLFLLHVPVIYAAKVIFCQDPSIVYSSGWYQDYSTPTQDLYLQTNQTNSTHPSLVATLPSNATSVDFVGYRRAGGSLYGYCIDCQDGNASALQRVNASDPTVTDQDDALESIIFTVQLDPSTQHTLSVYNLPDSQFNNTGEINLDHLLVEVQDNETTTDSSSLGPSSSSIPASSTPLSLTLFESTAVVDSGATLSASASAQVASSNSLPSVSFSTSSSVASATAIDSPSPSGAVQGASSGALDVPSPTAGSANSASSSAAADRSSSGLSKSVAIGVSILASVLGISIIVGLVAFLRQRREQRRNQFDADQNGRSSIIPIMPPPTTEMRTASANPFADPVPRAVESPVLSSPLQRSRNTSPTAPPSIPLPEPPIDIRTESRDDSPSGSFTRNDLWIARPVTPLKSKFSV